MPRSARIDIPNLLQHVIVRGIEKCKIFTDEDDRRQFLMRFSALLISTETDCFAWALLDNHFHLLLRPRRIPLAQFMRRLLTGYAVTFNLRHGRSGHLFQNRYKSLVCEEEAYLLELVRYIHLNPLRAGLLTSFDELDSYLWCGHGMLMGKGGLPGQVVAEVLSRFGTSGSSARRRYRLFVEDGIVLGNRNDLVGSGMQRRQSMLERPEEREQRDARVLGDGDFVVELLRQTGTHPPPAKVPMEEIIARVCRTLELPLSELMSQSRSPRIAHARSIICHLAFAGGHRGVDIARCLRLTASAVSIACMRGEKAIEQHPTLFEQGEPSRV
jgi:REP element-mobilizing transposase RayT